jgi:hypothetical protein
MTAINTSLLKFTWKGAWTSQTIYSKNDVVQYDNASFVCLKDIPREYSIGMDTGVSTEHYRIDNPRIYIKDRVPMVDNDYWKLIARGVNFKRGWMPHRIYKPGDMVRVGGDLYMCRVGGVRNTYVDDTTYWTKVFENNNSSLRRNWMVSYCNNAPLGWTRNNGDHPTTQTCDGYTFGAIDALGNVMSAGGWGSLSSYSTTGRGMQGSWADSWVSAGFTFVDWLRSTDVRSSLNISLSNIGLPTPDGKTPKCIQWVKNYYQALYLFNNGEVYASGYQNVGELGDNATSTSRAYPVRCTNQSSIGWTGETLPKNFNQTKIIKVDLSNNGIRSTAGTTSCFALGDDGSLWSWGYNAYGQLGHGLSTTISTDQFANKSIPTRIPAQFFDNKKIVDFMIIGNAYTSIIALDEDGVLWGWGCNYYGELGIGDMQTVTNVHPIPTEINYDFSRHGGIKKFTYYHMGTSDVRATYVLCNDGSLLMAGRAQQGMNPTTHLLGSANTQRNIYRFTKFTNTGPGALEIDNLWVAGDINHVIFAREKNSGRTFAIGGNVYGVMGSQSPTSYWWYSGGQAGGWSLVEGVRNLVHVTNTMYEMATTTANTYINPVLVTEDGRAWSQGRNGTGAAGLGWAGQSYDPVEQNPETGGNGNLYQPVKLPPNTKIATAMGMGSSGPDICQWHTDLGQALVTGGQGATTYDVQGNPWARSQGITMDRYTLHSICSD